ncbi:branched-chain amino acid ABC transporter permease [Xanthobacter sp. KR7-225]|uniref:branched-chain amino acid ABC transporter permease n=1 Tax=Xanthobacter sp. KR7-225 TaxID=3156613 RepID=UPI0032B4D6A8
MIRALIIIAGVSLAAWIVGSQLPARSYEVRVLCLILLAASMAQSWNIIGGLANQISLGHGAFFGIGAYASTILQLSYGLSPWLGALAGMAAAMLAALLLSLPTMRLKGPYFALATLAFAEACRVVANALPMTGGPQGVSVPFLGDSWAMLQFRAPGTYLPVFIGLFALTSLVFALLANGRIGYQLRALRENEDAAEVAGVATLRTKLIGSLASAALTALCGTLFAQFTFFIDPDSVFSVSAISIRMALIAIVGGVGTLIGPILGALAIVPLEEVLSATLSQYIGGIAPFTFGLVLIAIVLLRPRGLASLPGLRLAEGGRP